MKKSPLILTSTILMFFGTTFTVHAYLDPDTGTFITRDPTGFVDGPNLYTYVRQNPWTAFDPEGLELVYADPKVKEVVDSMRKSDPRLNRMVTDLEKSSHTHVVDKFDDKVAQANDVNAAKVKGIVLPDTGSFKAQQNEVNGKGVDTHIYISINLDHYKGSGDGSATSPDPRATAAHELQHARDYDRGEFAKEPDPESHFGALKYKLDPKTGLPISEERAVRTQNIWQEENAFKPRTKYGGKDIPDAGSQNSPLNETNNAQSQQQNAPSQKPENSARTTTEQTNTDQKKNRPTQ